MASLIGPLGGIKYGLKLLGYFIGVILIGGIITSIGIGITAAEVLPIVAPDQGLIEAQRSSPNVARIALGGAISLTGTSLTFAGFMGTLYKVLTDALYTANLKTRPDALSNE